MQKLKPLRELADAYGVDPSRLAELCRNETIPAERGPRNSFLVDVAAFKTWYTTQYRFRDRQAREGKRWNKQEVSELKSGKIPKSRTPLAAKLKRFHSKPA